VHLRGPELCFFLYSLAFPLLSACPSILLHFPFEQMSLGGWTCTFSGMDMCDRTTSEMSGLSFKIISGDSRRSENAQTHTNKHTRLNMKFKLKLLQIKCHVLGSYNRQSPKCASKDDQSFCGSVCLLR
jgi:hypothetical protein